MSFKKKIKTLQINRKAKIKFKIKSFNKTIKKLKLKIKLFKFLLKKQKIYQPKSNLIWMTKLINSIFKKKTNI